MTHLHSDKRIVLKPYIYRGQEYKVVTHAGKSFSLLRGDSADPGESNGQRNREMHSASQRAYLKTPFWTTYAAESPARRNLKAEMKKKEHGTLEAFDDPLSVDFSKMPYRLTRQNFVLEKQPSERKTCADTSVATEGAGTYVLAAAEIIDQNNQAPERCFQSGPSNNKLLVISILRAVVSIGLNDTNVPSKIPKRSGPPSPKRKSSLLPSEAGSLSTATSHSNFEYVLSASGTGAQRGNMFSKKKKKYKRSGSVQIKTEESPLSAAGAGHQAHMDNFISLVVDGMLYPQQSDEIDDKMSNSHTSIREENHESDTPTKEPVNAFRSSVSEVGAPWRCRKPKANIWGLCQQLRSVLGISTADVLRQCVWAGGRLGLHQYCCFFSPHGRDGEGQRNRTSRATIMKQGAKSSHFLNDGNNSTLLGGGLGWLISDVAANKREYEYNPPTPGLLDLLCVFSHLPTVEDVAEVYKELLQVKSKDSQCFSNFFWPANSSHLTQTENETKEESTLHENDEDSDATSLPLLSVHHIIKCLCGVTRQNPHKFRSQGSDSNTTNANLPFALPLPLLLLYLAAVKPVTATRVFDTVLPAFFQSDKTHAYSDSVSRHDTEDIKSPDTLINSPNVPSAYVSSTTGGASAGGAQLTRSNSMTTICTLEGDTPLNDNRHGGLLITAPQDVECRGVRDKCSISNSDSTTNDPNDCIDFNTFYHMVTIHYYLLARHGQHTLADCVLFPLQNHDAEESNVNVDVANMSNGSKSKSLLPALLHELFLDEERTKLEFENASATSSTLPPACVWGRTSILSSNNRTVMVHDTALLNFYYRQLLGLLVLACDDREQDPQKERADHGLSTESEMSDDIFPFLEGSLAANQQLLYFDRLTSNHHFYMNAVFESLSSRIIVILGPSIQNINYRLKLLSVVFGSETSDQSSLSVVENADFYSNLIPDSEQMRLDNELLSVLLNKWRNSNAPRTSDGSLSTIAGMPSPCGTAAAGSSDTLVSSSGYLMPIEEDPVQRYLNFVSLSNPIISSYENQSSDAGLVECPILADEVKILGKGNTSLQDGGGSTSMMNAFEELMTLCREREVLAQRAVRHIFRENVKSLILLHSDSVSSGKMPSVLKKTSSFYKREQYQLMMLERQQQQASNTRARRLSGARKRFPEMKTAAINDNNRGLALLSVPVLFTLYTFLFGLCLDPVDDALDGAENKDCSLQETKSKNYALNIGPPAIGFCQSVSSVCQAKSVVGAVSLNREYLPSRRESRNRPASPTEGSPTIPVRWADGADGCEQDSEMMTSPSLTSRRPEENHSDQDRQEIQPSLALTFNDEFTLRNQKMFLSCVPNALISLYFEYVRCLVEIRHSLTQTQQQGSMPQPHDQKESRNNSFEAHEESSMHKSLHNLSAMIMEFSVSAAEEAFKGSDDKGSGWGRVRQSLSNTHSLYVFNQISEDKDGSSSIKKLQLGVSTVSIRRSSSLVQVTSPTCSAVASPMWPTLPPQTNPILNTSSKASPATNKSVQSSKSQSTHSERLLGKIRYLQLQHRELPEQFTKLLAVNEYNSQMERRKNRQHIKPPSIRLQQFPSNKSATQFKVGKPANDMLHCGGPFPPLPPSAVNRAYKRGLRSVQSQVRTYIEGKTDVKLTRVLNPSVDKSSFEEHKQRTKKKRNSMQVATSAVRLTAPASSLVGSEQTAQTLVSATLSQLVQSCLSYICSAPDPNRDRVCRESTSETGQLRFDFFEEENMLYERQHTSCELSDEKNKSLYHPYDPFVMVMRQEPVNRTEEIVYKIPVLAACNKTE